MQLGEQLSRGDEAVTAQAGGVGAPVAREGEHPAASRHRLVDPAAQQVYRGFVDGGTGLRGGRKRGRGRGRQIGTAQPVDTQVEACRTVGGVADGEELRAGER
ncbi:hypothetical protein, partial [Streptomyces sp. CRB46]|uniref:hypothetical protein n=1 Tax=Streptomyces sp. CRB46 TaxID=2682613 RepID=UPI001F2F540F